MRFPHKVLISLVVMVTAIAVSPTVSASNYPVHAPHAMVVTRAGSRVTSGV